MICSDTGSLSRWPAASCGRRMVIAGAGTVGIYLGKLLADAGWMVRVLESGSTTPATFPSSTFTSVGKPHSGIARARSRSIGGASNLWAGQLVDLDPHDFTPRPQLTIGGWPIPYAELARHRATTLTRLGVPAELHADEPVWRAAVGTPPRLGSGVEAFLSRWMKTPSMAVLYGGEIRRNPRLDIRPDCTVVGFTTDGDRVVGALARAADGSHHGVDADCFVIAAGTIETVRLLLAAATAPSCPWGGNPLLGRRFQDHLGGSVGTITTTDRRRLLEIFATIYAGGHKFLPRVRLASEVLRADALLGVQGTLGFAAAGTEHLLHVKRFLRKALHDGQMRGLREALRHAAAAARHLPPLLSTYVRRRRMYVPSDARIAVVTQAEQRPTDESRIAIDPRRRDGFGLPHVVLDWRLGGAELRSIRAFALRLDSALQAGGIGRLEIPHGLLDEDPAFLDGLHDTYHAAGGAVMSAADAHGVVDGNLRVHGTRNLYVASAAVLPTTGSANVTFTTLCLATRLAAQLA